MSQTAHISLRQFAHEHDDLPAFHAAYFLLTLIAAGLLNLGFFAILITGHMILDVFKYREVHGFTWRKTAEGVIRESIVDLTLFFMGMVFAVYLHPTLTGLAGIKGIMLAEITILRSVGILTPKLKILYDCLKILSHVDLYLSRLHPKLGKDVSIVEYVCMFSLCFTIGLLMITPIVLNIPLEQFTHMLGSELIPWKL